MNAYMQRVLDEVKARNPHEKLFLQTVEEVFESLEPIVEKNSDLYEKYAVLERMCEPDRQIQFRVTWVDDAGKPPLSLCLSRCFLAVEKMRQIKAGKFCRPALKRSTKQNRMSMQKSNRLGRCPKRFSRLLQTTVSRQLLHLVEDY